MKSPYRVPASQTLALALAALFLSSGWLCAQNVWNQSGSAGTLLWSAPANWGYNASPSPADNLFFDTYGVTNVQGQVDNVVDANVTISSLSYDPLSSTNGYHTTQINPGVTLSVVPQSVYNSDAIQVGSWAPYGGVPTAGGANDVLYYTILGANGTLSVNGAASSIRIEQPDGTSGSHWATLDLARLGTFTASVSNVLLGANFPLTRPNGTLILAQTNTLTTGAWGTTIPGIILGCGGSTATDGGAGNLTLGQVNVLNVDWLAVGGHRGASQGTSTLGFGTITNGSFKLRSSAGSRAPLFTAGDSQAVDGGNSVLLNGTSRGATGVAEFRGNTVDILVDSLILGRNMTTNETTLFNTGATGTGNGTLNFDAGTIDVNTLYLGYRVGTNYGGATGTLLANGGTLSVNNGINMAFRSRPNGGFNGSSSTATLSISSNAVANVKGGDIAKGTAGQGTATLNVNFGGLVNLQPAGRPSPGSVSVDTLTINGGTLQNASNVTASGTVALTSTTLTDAGNTLSAATLNLNSAATVLNISNISVSGTLSLNGGNVTNGLALTAATINGSGAIATVANITNGTSLLLGSTASAGTLLAGGNFTAKTNATLVFAVADSAAGTPGGVNSYLGISGNFSPLSNNVLSIAPLAPLNPGTLRLIDYAGSLAGLPLTFTNTTRYNLSLDTPANQVNLVTAPGGGPIALTWTGSAAAGGTNWTYQTATNWNNQSLSFYQFDGVTFDANGVTTAINTTGLLYPQSITVNDSRTYTLGGSGKLSGNTGITKNGTGTLWITNTGGNDFNGNIAVNSGILKIGRNDSFGSTNGSTTVASGATLDLNGTSANSPGEFVTISGNGVNGTGAITNSGADQQNALRYVSLAADASTGVNAPGRWDVRGSLGNGTYSGALYLNGHTYTKNGPGKHELADATCTNNGNLVNAGGILAFTRSIVDGPGTISASGTNILQLENNTVGMVAKPFVFTGTSMLQLVGNSFALGSPVTNLNTGPAGLTIDTASGLNLTLTNVLTGSGAVTKTSSGSLTLQAPDTCTGPTMLSAGALVLTNAGSVPNTPSITLVTNTTFDVSALSGFTLGGSQSLSGLGVINGNLATSPGTTLAAGHPGALTVTGNLSLNGTTNFVSLGSDATVLGDGVNDLIAVGGNLNVSGVNRLVITPLAALDTTTPYTVLTYAGTLSGAGSFNAVSANPRYSFSVVDPSTTPGAIKVAVTGIPVSLTWSGGQPANPTLWDSGTTSNWLNSGVSDVFYPGDSVVFDDSALNNVVSIASTRQPSLMAVNNSSQNYTLSGAAGLAAGTLTKDGTGSFTLANTGTNTFALGLTINNGSLAIASTNVSAPSGIGLNGGTLAFSPPSPAADMTLKAAISDNGGGSGTLQKQGTNILTLTGNNSGYNGAIVVSSGTLKAGTTNALGTVNGGTTVANGATLDVNGLNLGRENVTASGPGAGSLGAIVNSGGNQNNALYYVTLAGDTTFGATGRWDIRGASAGDPAILSTGANAYKVTKVGANQHSWVNAAIDDALGDIDVQQGLFSLEHGTVSPNTRGIGDPSHTLTIFGGATLQFNSLDNPLNKTIVMRDGSTITNQNGDNTISSSITLNGSNYVYVGASTLSLNGNNSLSGSALNGGGTLVMNGPNTLNLYSGNNWSGGMLINGGNVAIDNSLAFTANKNIVLTTTTGGGGATGTRITLGITALGSWTIPPGVSVNLPSGQPGDLRSILYANKGTTEWQGPINFYAQAGALTPGSVGISSDATNSLFTVSGPMSGVVTNLALRGNNQGIGKVYGTINLSNPGGLPPRLEKTELSLWTLYANNNVWGDTIVHEGTLQLGINNACPPAGLMTIGQQNFACVLDLNGFNQQVSGLASDVNPQYQFVANSSVSANSTLTILGTNVTTFAGTIMDQAVLWSPTNLIGGSQVGLTLAAGNTGTLTLSGTNAYTGPTLLNSGTLLVNGALSNTVVTVNSGATLGGTGIISGPVTVNAGGIVALGPALGTLAINNTVHLNAGSTTVMKVNLNTVTLDRIVGATSLTYGGTLVVTNVGTASLSGVTGLKLFDATSYGGAFANIVPAIPAPNATWDTSSLTVNGTLKIVSSVNPTPTNLTAVVSGSQLTLSWPADHIGWSLQTNAVNVTLPSFWFVFPGSAATNQVILNIDQTKTNVFFRMALP